MLCRQFQWLRSPKSELLKSLKAPHAHSATLKPLIISPAQVHNKVAKKGEITKNYSAWPWVNPTAQQ